MAHQHHDGTTINCGCHGNRKVAVVDLDRQAVVIRNRQHGEHHERTLSLPEIVRTLDPAGTTARLVGTA